jgi:hypothetical protein
MAKSLKNNNDQAWIEDEPKAGFDPCQPLFQVTFSCLCKGIVAVKLNAPSAEAAEKIAQELIEEAHISPPERDDLHYEAMMGGKCTPTTLDVRPAENGRGFDLRKVDFGPHLK